MVVNIPFIPPNPICVMLCSSGKIPTINSIIHPIVLGFISTILFVKYPTLKVEIFREEGKETANTKYQGKS